MQRQAISVSWGAAATLLSRVALPAIGCRSRLPLRRVHWLAVLGASFGLAACSTPPGSFDVEDSTQTKLTTLMALVEFKKPPRSPEPTDHVICPNIVILDGTADDRVYGKGEETNANLRYQFSLNDVARDCKIDGGQISLKVGTAGKVLLGPVGSPGNFTAPIRVAIIRESDQQPVVSKLYHVAVSVPAGKTQALFTLVTEPLDIPYTHENAQHDYTIKVGFDAADNDKRQKAMLHATASAPNRPAASKSSSDSPHHGHHRRANPTDANPSTD